MGVCNACIDEVPDSYLRKYRIKVESAPGATSSNVNNMLWLLGGFALGAVATVIFINISGETSFKGLARKTVDYGRQGISTLDKAWGG